MGTLDVRGVSVAFIDRGRGSPVLLLHGNPDCSSLWEGLIDRLQAEHRCLAPDLPGFGGSRAPEDSDYSLENAARFTDAFVTAAGVSEPVSLVVHDIGGFFGLAWAVRHPERVGRIAVTNTFFHSDYRWHFWARVWRRRGLGELAMALMRRWSFAQELRRGSPRLPREHIERSYAAFTPSVRRAVLRLYRESDPEKFRGWDERLLELTGRIPTRVYWGGRDPYIPSSLAHRFGAEAVQIYPDCGHWTPVEAVEPLGDELRRFFADDAIP